MYRLDSINISVKKSGRALRTDFIRVFEERMNENSFIDAVDDEHTRAGTRRYTGMHQVFNVAEWNINGHHTQVPSSNTIHVKVLPYIVLVKLGFFHKSL